jgi:hypothetical protein
MRWLMHRSNGAERCSKGASALHAAQSCCDAARLHEKLLLTALAASPEHPATAKLQTDWSVC